MACRHDPVPINKMIPSDEGIILDCQNAQPKIPDRKRPDVLRRENRDLCGRAFVVFHRERTDRVARLNRSGELLRQIDLSSHRSQESLLGVAFQSPAE